MNNYANGKERKGKERKRSLEFVLSIHRDHRAPPRRYAYPPWFRFHRKSRSGWWRRPRTTTTMTTSWSVGCQPDMLNEYGSLVKDRKERVETRYARIYARSPTVINHFQTRARTMRVVPPESARSGDLLLPPTLSPRFCFRSPKPSFKRIQYASITPPTAIILVYTLYLHDAISRFSIGRIPKLISNQRFYFLLLFLPLLISRLSSLEIPFEMLEERSSSKRNIRLSRIES